VSHVMRMRLTAPRAPAKVIGQFPAAPAGSVLPDLPRRTRSSQAS
jgi:hypothetical protein